jgi:hypothetical protein
MIPTSLIVFVAITSVAVVLQMAILLALYLSVKRATSQVEGIALDLQRRTTPIIENARDIIADATPKLKEITTNLTQASATLKVQAETLGNAAVEVVVRARNQVVHADNIVSRALDRVEKTSESVQNSVLTPVRRVQGIMQALSVGLGTFLNQKRQTRQQREAGPGDEGMFV